jgi:1-acyl-sn-glycerol-3-phosphate acyltransferase
MIKNFVYFTIRKLLRLFFKLAYSLEVEGLENIPKKQALIYAANHESLLDGILLFAALPGRVHFLITDKFLVCRLLGRLLNYVVVSLNPRKNHLAIRNAVKHLKLGRSIAIFPEGKIRRKQQQSPAKKGVCLMARISGVPVIPVGIKGTSNIFKRSKRSLFGQATCVVIGEAILPQGLEESELKVLLMKKIAMLKYEANERTQLEFSPLEGELAISGVDLA